MDLKEFIENKFECKINLSDDDLQEFLSYYDVYIYDYKEIKDELCCELEIDEFLIDFIKFRELAEYQNYEYVNDDLYIDGSGLHYFENNYNDYGKNIDDMINDWRETV